MRPVEREYFDRDPNQSLVRRLLGDLGGFLLGLLVIGVLLVAFVLLWEWPALLVAGYAYHSIALALGGVAALVAVFWVGSKLR